MEGQRHVVAGTFFDRHHAQQSLADLYDAGFTSEEIGIVARGTCTASGGEELTGSDIEKKHALEGAGVGAIAGAGLGGLIGLGIIAGVIPVLGPVFVGGTLGVILSNAAAGVTAGGIIGALTGVGIPEYEAVHCERDVEAGRTVVTVTTEKNIEEAVAILNQHGASAYRPVASVEPAVR